MDTIDNRLTNDQFQKISQLLYEISGISLCKGKEELVKARLSKRLRALHLQNFNEYLQYLKDDKSGHELSTMTDELTTNKTNFFREIQHFEFLKKQILPEVARTKQLRIWCAGCSSGEEPYSIAVCLKESIPGIDQWNVKILATDISPTMLQSARNGIYSANNLLEINETLKKKYFLKVDVNSDLHYQVKDTVKKIIKFARLNLMTPWPMKGPFDLILCRNVMIYFDKPTREKLINRFWELIRPNGHLFVGHSESLTGTANRFNYIQPAIYRK